MSDEIKLFYNFATIEFETPGDTQTTATSRNSWAS